MSKRRDSTDRRYVLRALIAASMVLVTPKWAVADPTKSRNTQRTQFQVLWALAAELGRADSIDVLAADFLARFPNRANVDTLTKALLEWLRSTNASSQLDSLDAMRDGLARSVRADFIAGRIVSIDGWQLSSTELELCALSKTLTTEQLNAGLSYLAEE